MSKMPDSSAAPAAQPQGFWHRATDLYVDGFRTQSRTSRKLWAIILIKLFIMFAILRAFFFPNFLAKKGDSTQKATYVMEQLITDGSERVEHETQKNNSTTR